MGPAIGQHKEKLLARYLRREGGLDGQFLVGVLSTGIYCLPSCPARRPNPENVVLVESEAEAQGLGLRACKRCRPHLWGRGVDRDLEGLRRVLGELWRRPSAIAGVADLARAMGVGRTKLNQLTRRHYHLSSAALLIEARLAHAARALRETDARVIDVALGAGFESPSAFHKNFRARFGLTPKAYSDLGKIEGDREVALRLPLRFDPTDMLSFFGRDANGVSERRRGSRAQKALLLDGRPAVISLSFEAGRVFFSVRGPRPISRSMRYRAHGVLVRQLGLTQDPSTFERRALLAGHGNLIQGQRGARLPLSADPWEALVWAIIGQQINLTFAAACRSRLVELAGSPAGEGLRAHPDAERIAELSPEDLLGLQFSRRKAEYLLDVAGKVAGGELDLVGLAREPVQVIEERLLAQRGLGPWTVRYVQMRGYGLADCVPVGDAGLSAALRDYCALSERPGPEEQEQLLEPFAPFRSLAVFHLWKRLQAQPRKKA